MSQLIREATLGQVLNRLSKGRILPYEDQRPGWVSPLGTPKNNSQTTLHDQKSPSPFEEKALEDGVSSTVVGWYDDNDQDNPMYALLFLHHQRKLTNFVQELEPCKAFGCPRPYITPHI